MILLALYPFPECRSGKLAHHNVVERLVQWQNVDADLTVSNSAVFLDHFYVKYCTPVHTKEDRTIKNEHEIIKMIVA